VRPTIPIGEWRLSLDLQKTGLLQDSSGAPARGCDCAWCRNWRACHSQVLPDGFAAALKRLKLRPESPSDLYANSQDEAGCYCRITYHVVGRVTSGPHPFLRGPEGGGIWEQNYQQLRPRLGELQFWVGASSDITGDTSWAPEWAQPLVAVDLRGEVPWALPEPQPPVSFG
jgi:hypothetical protein